MVGSDYEKKNVNAAEKTSSADDAIRRGSVIDSVTAGELADPRYLTTSRGLKSRHAQMIALGGTIGTGLFVGSGSTLAIGGPLFILLGYSIMTAFVWCVVQGLTEMATFLPVHGGSMSYFGHRFASRSLGFSMGYLYWYSLGILVPYEITAAGIVIDYWNVNVNIAVWISIMVVVIVALNFSPVKVYGETEFWFASLKVIMMLVLLGTSFILFWGGGPEQHGILGFHYWKNPGAMNEYLATGNAGHFVAFLYTLVLSAFPFTFAPELLVVTAGEMELPRINVPKASRRYFYRLIFFYIGCVLAIGVICSSKDSQLTNGGAGAASSAFVIGIQNAGIPVLNHLINAIIITSAWSSGNSFLYISSRALYALAISGDAPHIFKKCNKHGVPYLAVLASSLFAPLAYLNCGTSGSTVFSWFVSMTNTSGFISWMLCGIVFLRFRKACDVQGVKSPYYSRFQPYAAWASILMFGFMVLINGFVVFFPSEWTVSGFFTSYIGILMYLAFYVPHKLIVGRKDPMFRGPEQVDLVSGLDEVEALHAHIDMENYRPPKKNDLLDKMKLGFVRRIYE